MVSIAIYLTSTQLVSSFYWLALAAVPVCIEFWYWILPR